MHVAVLTVRLHASWVHSLKEKRMEVKSLLAKLRNKFNVSAAETAEQDIHQIIVLSIAAIAGNAAQADSMTEAILQYLENNTEAEITDVLRELR